MTPIRCRIFKIQLENLPRKIKSIQGMYLFYSVHKVNIHIKPVHAHGKSGLMMLPLQLHRVEVSRWLIWL